MENKQRLSEIKNFLHTIEDVDMGESTYEWWQILEAMRV